MQNEFTLRKKRGLGDIISDSFSYYKTHIVQLMKALLIIPTPIIVVGSIFFGFYYGEFLAAAFQQNESAIIGNMALLFIGVFVLGLGYLMLHVVVVEYLNISTKVAKEDITFGMIVKALKKNFLYYILGTIIIMIIIGLGSLIFILPGIFLYVVFSVYYYPIAVEGKDPIEAVKRSFQIIWGRWWHSFGLLILMSIIVSLIVYALTFPINLISGFSDFSNTNPEELQEKLQLFATVYFPIQMIFSSLFSSLLLVSIGINYYSIVEEQDEVGLKERISSIETQESKEERAEI